MYRTEDVAESTTEVYQQFFISEKSATVEADDCVSAIKKADDEKLWQDVTTRMSHAYNQIQVHTPLEKDVTVQ